MNTLLQKPPIGLLPLFIHNGKRLDAINAAMTRYGYVEKPIPKDWIDEKYLLLTYFEDFKVCTKIITPDNITVENVLLYISHEEFDVNTIQQPLAEEEYAINIDFKENGKKVGIAFNVKIINGLLFCDIVLFTEYANYMLLRPAISIILNKEDFLTIKGISLVNYTTLGYIRPLSEQVRNIILK